LQEWGNKLEDIIRAEFAERNQVKILATKSNGDNAISTISFINPNIIMPISI